MIKPAFQYLDYVNHFVAVIEADEDGTPRYVAFNRHARALAGLHLSDVVGKTARELYPGRWGEVAFQAHVAAFESGTERTFEAILPMSGARHFVRTTLVPEIGSEGRVSRLFATAVDAIEDGVSSDVSADRSDAEDFVKLAAHDLRAPVRNVKVISGMLREEFVEMGNDKVQLLDMLDAVSDKAMHLLDDIVTFAQTSVPGQSSEVVFEFHDLVRDLMDVLDPLGRAQVQVETALVSCDRNVMQMALRNLIDNALKHAGQADGRQLDLVLAVSANGFDRLDITVEDNGGGFKDTALLFLNGGRLKPGSGFGLLGVRRLVRARGGMMSAATLPGGRARVQITLPGRLLSNPHSYGPRGTVRSRLRA